MPRYIDADEFIKRVVEYPRQSTKTIGQALADTPTADFVKVVRCKDCRFSTKMKREDGSHYRVCLHHFFHGLTVEDTDFCSQGR